MQVTVGTDNMHVVSGADFLSRCAQLNVCVEVDMWGRINLSGTSASAESARIILAQWPQLEAATLLELMGKNEVLRELIEERIAIREADGLPGDYESAISAHVGVV